MDFIFSLLWYLFIGKVIKDKPTVKTGKGRRHAKQDFIFLVDQDSGNLSNHHSSDPFINGDSTDGPEW